MKDPRAWIGFSDFPLIEQRALDEWGTVHFGDSRRFMPFVLATPVDYRYSTVTDLARFLG